MIQSTAISQVILKHGDTNYHCYTPNENRILGLTIYQKLSQDTLLVLYKDKISIKDSIIKYQYDAISIQDSVIQKQNVVIQKDKRTLQKMKYFKFATVGLLITTIIFIFR